MATYYKRNTNPTNSNWNQNDNWSTVSSVSATNTGTYPTTFDTAIFDAPSVTCTVNVASACTTLTMTGYNTNLVMNNTLTVSGACTLPSGASGALTGTSALVLSGTQTLTTNGSIIPALTSTTASSVKTIVGNLTVTNFTVTNNTTFNGNKFIITGTTVFSGNCAGTTIIEFQTGAILTGGTGICANPFVLNGNVTWNGNVYVGTGMNWTYTSGTITTTGGTLTIASSGVTLTGWGTNVSGLILNTTSTTPASTVTPTTDLYFSTISGASNTYLTVSHATYKLYISGGLQTSGVMQINGTSELTLNGTGTINNASLSLYCPIVINTSGTITIGSVVIRTSLKYVAGSISITGLGVLNCYNTTSLDISDIPTRISVTMQNIGNLTLLSNLVCRVLSPNPGVALTLAGAFNTDCEILRIPSTGSIIPATGQTVTVQNAIEFNGTTISVATYGSATDTTYLSYLGTMSACKICVSTIRNVDATSSVVPIYDWYGTVANCTNVYAVTGANLQNIIGVI